ncbi:hypothetical protein [Hyphomicrobium sp. ghe19]|uniref:hypothetical protein n=1 Tax=Hyphomicrobium sp. ghe19 TaxID=2682968 RepID=UPI001367551F|nr:hypothetical protein HYPP_02391 [Hyphomicrobium sp. ghe19]
MPQVIDLSRLTGNGKVKNLSGHDKGTAARRSFDLDVLDHSSEPVDVVVPPFVYAVSSSFVQGMFKPSLNVLGTLEAFFEHYRFVADAAVIRQIERALTPSRLAAA